MKIKLTVTTTLDSNDFKEPPEALLKAFGTWPTLAVEQLEESINAGKLVEVTVEAK